MPITRFEENPLIRPADVKPSREDFEVVCTFNPGCTRIGDEILLFIRVAERPACKPGEVIAPVLHPDDPAKGIHFLRVKKNDPDFEDIDTRVFKYKGQTYLTSISHFRIARSKDGRNFTVDPQPAMAPEGRLEEFGIEDPRITKINEQYYINYSAISRHGIATAAAVTKDFKTFQRQGIIFAPENRDVTIFPERINDTYVCFHRPVSASIGGADMWLASSPDLRHWGNHRHVCGPREGMWDDLKVGGGAVPIKTDRGWLEIYHGADQQQRYCLGVLLTDLEHPEKVIARSKLPLLAPQAKYERTGFFGNVVFSCGAIVDPPDRVIIYYGAADECIAAAEITIDDLLATVT